MADTNTNSAVNRHKRGHRLAGHLAPDMTSMVGLGFLLVTFFIMAAEFAKPSLIELAMPVRPKQDDNSVTICGGTSAMTLILGKNHQVHYYPGLFASDITPELQTTNFGEKGLRQVLLKLQQQNPNTLVLIKPTDDAKYKDMVDVLDEMNITNQRKYALVDITKEEAQLLKANSI